MNHRRPNFDELTPDDLFRPEPVDGARTGGTIAGEVLYSSREPIPPAQPTQALPQPWDGQQQPPYPTTSGQPEYFGEVTSVGGALPGPGPMPGPLGAGPLGGGPMPPGGEGATQFLPPFPQPEPGYDYSAPQTYGSGYPDQGQGPLQGQAQGPLQNQGYADQGQLQDQGYQDPQAYPQQQGGQIQPYGGQQASYGGQQASYGGQQASYGQPTAYGQPVQQPSYGGQPPYGQQPGGGYSGGGSGYAAPGGGGSARRRFSNRAIAIAAIAVCAVVGISAAALAGGGGGAAKSGTTASSSVSSSASTAPVSESKVQAQALSDLLATAANGRSAVIAAVGNVKGCQSLSQSQQDLTTAAGLRKQLIQQLGLLQTNQLAHGSELVGELRQGWQASADADTHYAAWAAQSVSSCAHTHHPSTGGQLEQGDAASGTATDAKAKAARLWNDIAKQTGMPERSGSQL